jgi:RNA polymerase sigma factor (sigma-70 family)
MNQQEQQIYTELLVVRCQQGEQEAFRLLVELWQKPLVMFALRYLEGEIESWDAVQETWISVIKGLGKLQNPSRFASWLFSILTNKCIDLLRKKQAESRLLKKTNDKSNRPTISDENELLIKAIGQLPDEQKTLVILRFGQGLQVNQIAAILSVPEGTIKSKLHRTIIRLREILGDKI